MTPKVYIVRYRRKERIAKSLPDEQKADIKAFMVDKLAKGSEVQKVIVTSRRKPKGRTT